MLSEVDMGTNPNISQHTQGDKITGTSAFTMVDAAPQHTAHCLSTLHTAAMAPHCARELDRTKAGNFKNDQNCSSRRKRLRTLARPLRAPKDPANRAEYRSSCTSRITALPAASAATFLATVART